MPIFEQASYTTVNGGTFIEHGNQSDVLMRLSEFVVWSATHKSDDHCDQPKCHPETRDAILEKIGRWADGAEEQILWIRGPAGAGKSAICRTLAEMWQQRGILGASFFFLRSAADRNNRRGFLSTIAYQLGERYPCFQAHFLDAISRDPLIFKKSFNEQLHSLIVSPLYAIINPGGSFPVIVIDGLDECSVGYKGIHHEDQQGQILQAIATVVGKKLPIRFLVASRPERQIRESFAEEPLSRITSQIELTGGSDADKDIETFLKDKFDEIIHKKPTLDTTWPPADTIPRLVKMSSGYFIYPSTVIRHLSSPHINPEESLREILGHLSPINQTSHPFAQLDALYIHILESVASTSQQNVSEILQLLIRMSYLTIKPQTYDTGTQVQSLQHLADILCTTSTQIFTDLVDLHSILAIPENSKAGPIRFIHASFGDFLVDPARSGVFIPAGRHPFMFRESL